MDKVSKIVITIIGIFFGLLGIFFITVVGNLFLFSLNILLYILFSSIAEDRITYVIGNLLLISSLLAMIGFFTGITTLIPFRVNFSQISGAFSVIALLLFFIYYLYSTLKEILQSIEIKLKK
ncbi:MAG: hypothetical protein QXY16_01850 [Nanopusillaceae archaeon]